MSNSIGLRKNHYRLVIQLYRLIITEIMDIQDSYFLVQKHVTKKGGWSKKV